MDNSSESSKLRVYSVSIGIIVVGIAAITVAAIMSITMRASTPLLVCELVSLVCLVGALVAVVLAKNHIARHEEKIRLNPYANVDKKEIDKVLDMISREENRRQKSEAFAAGSSTADTAVAQNAVSGTDTTAPAHHASSEATDVPPEEDELTFLLIDDEVNEVTPPDAVPVVLPNDGSADDADITEDDDAAPAEKDSPIDKETEEEDNMNRGYDDYDDRAPRRRSAEDADRRERDPYYDDYYEERPRQRAPRDARDPYAQRDRDREAVHYNEYGEPVRRRRPAYDPYYDDYYAERPRQRGPRDSRDPYASRSRDPYASRPVRDRDGVYYDEYGEPIRRRPAAYDDRDRRQMPPRRRRSDGYPDPRQPRYEDEDARRSAGAAPSADAVIDDRIETVGAVAAPTEAAVASAPASTPEYDENYVPVVIPDDEYDYDAVQHDHHGRAGVGSLYRPAPASAAQPARRGGRDDDESIPVALPDDEAYENRYASDRDAGYRQPPAASAPAPETSAGRGRARYVPDYEEEEMVVSLPRDDEYDSYVEKKREEEAIAEQQRLKEQRRAERIASGKVVLTIVKLRRRKIRRRSRKYRNFRASVHHLNEYLHSFSAHGKNKQQ